MKGKEGSGVMEEGLFSWLFLYKIHLGWMTPLTEDQRLLSKTLTQNIDFLLPGSANYSHLSPFHLQAILGLPHPPTPLWY